MAARGRRHRSAPVSDRSSAASSISTHATRGSRSRSAWRPASVRSSVRRSGAQSWAAELLYRDDVESEVLVPSFVATIIAFAIFGAVEGFSPIFGTQARFGFSDPVQLVWYALIGARLRARRPPVHPQLLRAHRLVQALGVVPRAVGRRSRASSSAASASSSRAPSAPGTASCRPSLDRQTLLVGPALDRPRPAVREDPRHLALDRVRGLGRHLRARNGHRRVARRRDLAAARADRARRSRSTRPPSSSSR